MSVDDRLREVFTSVLGIDSGSLGDSDSPDTLAEWDSVAHIQLLMAIEAEFDIEFDPAEIAELVSVRMIRDRLQQEGASAG